MNIKRFDNITNTDNFIFASYVGVIDQELLSNLIEEVDQKLISKDIRQGTRNNIQTIVIELTQNIIHYYKTLDKKKHPQAYEGHIVILQDKDDAICIYTQSFIENDNKNILEKKLNLISTMSKDELKHSYKQLRRSGENSHANGAGIGFYEIARRSDEIEFLFQKNQNHTHQFHFLSKVHLNK